MCPVFGDRIISRTADVVWPPRGCNLTPLDHYLWGAVKDKCYVDQPETIDTLKDNIREIQLHTIDNVHFDFLLLKKKNGSKKTILSFEMGKDI